MKRLDHLEALADIYKAQLKEEDKKGYSEIYKQCTENFIQQLESCKDMPFHVEDLRYEDGYFIFAHGSNAVVKFHITECPGWLFGIWWSVPDEETRVDIAFFTQFESTIDKFKPSASMFCEEQVYATLKDSKISEFYSFYHFAKLIKYIHEVPALAFCRDYFYYDYNKEYLPLEVAEARFKETLEKQNKEIEIGAKLDVELLDFYDRKILPAIPGSYLRDDGKNVSPRYQLCVPSSCLTLNLKLGGHYSLELFLDHDIFSQLKDCYKFLDKRAEDEEITWYAPVDMNIQVFIE